MRTSSKAAKKLDDSDDDSQPEKLPSPFSKKDKVTQGLTNVVEVNENNENKQIN
jgi:hypothetical protein